MQHQYFQTADLVHCIWCNFGDPWWTQGNTA